MVRLSRGELEFIVGGAAVDIRGDGRGVLEFREMTMESAVIASASGEGQNAVVMNAFVELLFFLFCLT